MRVLSPTITLALLLTSAGAAADAVPTVDSVVAVQDSVTRLVEVTYDLSDTDGDSMNVSLWLSIDGGGTFSFPCESVAGDVGAGIESGMGKAIEWDALADYPGHVGEYQVRVEALERVPTARVGFVRVPAGNFVMGDREAICGTDERRVTLTRGFELGTTEVTNQQYASALEWAYEQGHVIVTLEAVHDSMDGSIVELFDLDDPEAEISFVDGEFVVDQGKTNHPVIELSWYGAAAYCDWLSLMDGFPRAYDHSTWMCNGADPYGARGYRLPTDAEWEYAAQFDDERIYPWGDEVPDCTRANSYGCNTWTVPVGSCPPAPASLGLYDMAGNVSEWCEDAHTCDLGSDAEEDPSRFEGAEAMRVHRGGHYGQGPVRLRCASRSGQYPELTFPEIGFRAARTLAAGHGVSPPFQLDTRDTADLNDLVAPNSTEPDAFQSSIRLLATLPEPAGAATRITLALTRPDFVSVRIVRVTGSPVRTLVDYQLLDAGEHQITWDGKDSHGRDAPNGVYFVQLTNRIETMGRRITLVR